MRYDAIRARARNFMNLSVQNIGISMAMAIMVAAPA